MQGTPIPGPHWVKLDLGRCLLLAVYYWLLIIGCLLLAVDYSLRSNTENDHFGEFLLKMMDFTLTMMDFTLKLMDFTLKMMEFRWMLY